MIEIPGAADSGAGAVPYQISIRNFRKIEGSFVLPAGLVAKAVEARIMQGGVIKASRRTTL
jgi:hypothetical protein